MYQLFLYGMSYGSAFCFNFDGRTVNAVNQLSNMVSPLMRRIGRENFVEDVLFYALNAHRGRTIKNKDYAPARDFMSFGFGFDILGDKHVSWNLPPSVFKKMKKKRPEFQFFHKEAYFYRSYPYSTLSHNLPNDTKLDPDRILQLKNRKYLLQALLNAEQEGKEANNLRPTIDEGRTTEYIETKQGIEEENVEKMKKVKNEVSKEESQTRLDELDNLF